MKAVRQFKVQSLKLTCIPASLCPTGERGFLLVSLLATVGLVSTLVLSMAMVSLTESRAAQSQVVQLQAYYRAEGKIDQIVAALRADDLRLESGTIVNLAGLTGAAGDTAQDLGGDKPVRVVVTGSTPTISSPYTLTAYIRTKMPTDFYDYVVYAAGGLYYDGESWTTNNGTVAGKIKLGKEPPEQAEPNTTDLSTAPSGDQPVTTEGTSPTDVYNYDWKVKVRVQDAEIESGNGEKWYQRRYWTRERYTTFHATLATEVTYDPTIYPLPRFRQSALKAESQKQGNYYGPGGKSSDSPLPTQFYYQPPAAQNATTEEITNLVASPDNTTDTQQAPKVHPGVPNVIFIDDDESATALTSTTSVHVGYGFGVPMSASGKSDGVVERGGFVITDKPLVIGGHGQFHGVFYTPSIGGMGLGVDDWEVWRGVFTKTTDDNSSKLEIDGAAWSGGDVTLGGNQTSLVYNQAYMEAIKALEIPAEIQVLAIKSGRDGGTGSGGGGPGVDDGGTVGALADGLTEPLPPEGQQALADAGTAAQDGRTTAEDAGAPPSVGHTADDAVATARQQQVPQPPALP